MQHLKFSLTANFRIPRESDFDFDALAITNLRTYMGIDSQSNLLSP